MSHRVSQNINWMKVMNRVLVKMIGSKSVIWITRVIFGFAWDPTGRHLTRDFWFSDAWDSYGAVITLTRRLHGNYNGIYGQIPARMLMIGVGRCYFGISQCAADGARRSGGLSLRGDVVHGCSETFTSAEKDKEFSTLKINGCFHVKSNASLSSYDRV